MPTTEILVASLKPGSNIGDPSNEAAAILKEVGDQLNNTEGVQQINFGMQVENPDTFQLMVTWDKLDSHKAFMATEAYQPFLQRFMSIVDGPPSMMHVDLEPSGDALKTMSAPATEIATFYFGSDPPAGYLDGVSKFRDIIAKENVEGYLGGAVGITHEEVEREGVNGKGAVLLIGWSSVETHMKFRESETFKNNIGLLREGVQKIEMHHVQFLNFAAAQ